MLNSVFLVLRTLYLVSYCAHIYVMYTVFRFYLQKILNYYFFRI